MRHRIMEALALLGGALLAASLLLQGPGGLRGDPTSSASVRAGTSDQGQELATPFLSQPAES